MEIILFKSLDCHYWMIILQALQQVLKTFCSYRLYLR